MLFSEYLEFIQADNPGPNGHKAASTAEPTAVIGAPLSRVDGPLKTTGSALYASDYNFPNMVYAVPVGASIASGKILSVDTSVAEKMPGVLTILYHGNFDPVFRNASGGRNSEQRPPFEDDTVYYWGQYVALAVAETFAQAQAAAGAVKISYAPAKFNVATDLSDPMPAVGEPGGPRVLSHRGDPESAFAAAPIKIDYTYTTPVETHNPMEMHATVAVFDGKKFTLYESSQGVMNHLNVMAQVLGVPKENVEVISRFIGSGFGGKLFPWPHSALAAVAARRLNRPVKLTLSRKMMFANVGHRPRTQQRIRLGASPDGKLLSLSQDYRNHTSINDDIRENCGEATPFLYRTANLQVSSALVRRNIGTPTPMRGPGAVPGLFALESAMDELAIKLQKDPVQLRLSLDTLIDEEKNKPFSSRHLKECLEVGSRKFGWDKRTPAVGSMRKGDLILGWGVAAASWSAGRGVSEASVSLCADGSARVSSGSQDPGTGTYTVIAQIVSDKTGIPVSRIQSVLGSSSLPPGPTSGGSTATATIIPSVAEAAVNAVKVVLATAASAKGSPFLGKQPTELAMSSAVFTSKVMHPIPAFLSRKSSSSATSPAPTGKAKQVAMAPTPMARTSPATPSVRSSSRSSGIRGSAISASAASSASSTPAASSTPKPHATRWPELSSWVLVWACSRAPPMILAMAIPSTTTSPTMLSQRLPTIPTSTSPSSTSPTP